MNRFLAISIFLNCTLVWVYCSYFHHYKNFVPDETVTTSLSKANDIFTKNTTEISDYIKFKIRDKKSIPYVYQYLEYSTQKAIDFIKKINTIKQQSYIFDKDIIQINKRTHSLLNDLFYDYSKVIKNNKYYRNFGYERTSKKAKEQYFSSPQFITDTVEHFTQKEKQFYLTVLETHFRRIILSTHSQISSFSIHEGCGGMFTTIFPLFSSEKTFYKKGDLYTTKIGIGSYGINPHKYRYKVYWNGTIVKPNTAQRYLIKEKAEKVGWQKNEAIIVWVDPDTRKVYSDTSFHYTYVKP